MEHNHISSSKNLKVKELSLLLEKSKHRRERALFCVEGEREVQNAISGGFTPYEIYYCPQIIDKNHPLLSLNIPTYSLSKDIYEKLAYRGGTEGIITIFEAKERSLEQITLSNNPLVVILESIEKPGNLGAILRTADAAMIDAVIICDPLTDLYNPNIIRSSIGGVFTQQVVCAESQEIYSWLKSNNISILTAELQASKWYTKTNLTKPSAIVMGSESDGLKTFWRERADYRIKIPMLGKLDSLNVSVSTAIICYEAIRQRGIY